MILIAITAISDTDNDYRKEVTNKVTENEAMNQVLRSCLHHVIAKATIQCDYVVPNNKLVKILLH